MFHNSFISRLSLSILAESPFVSSKYDKMVINSLKIGKSFSMIFFSTNGKNLEISQSYFKRCLGSVVKMRSNIYYPLITASVSYTQTTILKESVFSNIKLSTGNIVSVYCNTGFSSLSNLAFIDCSSGSSRGIAMMSVNTLFCTRVCYISCNGACPSLYTASTTNHYNNYTSEFNLSTNGVDTLGAHFVGNGIMSIKYNNCSFLKVPVDSYHGCIWYFVSTPSSQIGSFNNAVHNYVMSLIGFHLGGSTASIYRFNYVNNTIRPNGSFGTNCCSSGSLTLSECVFVSSTWNKPYSGYYSHTLIFSSCYMDFEYTTSRFSGFGTSNCVFLSKHSTYHIDPHQIAWCLGNPYSKPSSFTKRGVFIILMPLFI